MLVFEFGLCPVAFCWTMNEFVEHNDFQNCLPRTHNERIDSFSGRQLMLLSVNTDTDDGNQMKWSRKISVKMSSLMGTANSSSISKFS